MKNYPHIISRLLYEPLLLTPRKHAVLCSVIESAMEGRNLESVILRDEQEQESEIKTVGKTQIIPIHGTIARHSDGWMSGGCGLDEVHQQLDLAEYDEEVANVLLDFRTDGGEVTGVPELGRRIYNFPKKTVGYCEANCNSAGMWLMSQCQRAFATPSATLGSIGVWTAYFDYSRALANKGVNVQTVFAGEYKLMGAYWKPLSPEETKIIQGQVDKIYGQFKQAVRAVRPVSDDAMGNGLCFDGEEAAERGLVDGLVERMDDILDEMVELG